VKYSEQAVSFACQQGTLVGVLALPENAAASLGVVVIVGGPQYRAGSHRQFVLLARALAAGGYPVLRFDYRGMGDSTGAQRDFLQVTPDIAAAVDAMQQQLPAVKQVALWGLCDGASAALLYCHDTHDPRVKGLCLANPWVRSAASLARTRVKHYYLQRLRQKDFWTKLLSGKVALGALQGLLQNIRAAGAGTGRDKRGTTAVALPGLTAAPFQQRMAKAWRDFHGGGGILLLLSGADYTAKEFVEYAQADAAWSRILDDDKLERQDMLEADHTFSNNGTHVLVGAVTLEWLKR
jgi:exosortase A-associated hydrolase 1